MGDGSQEHLNADTEVLHRHGRHVCVYESVSRHRIIQHATTNTNKFMLGTRPIYTRKRTNVKQVVNVNIH